MLSIIVECTLLISSLFNKYIIYWKLQHRHVWNHLYYMQSCNDAWSLIDYSFSGSLLHLSYIEIPSFFFLFPKRKQNFLLSKWKEINIRRYKSNKTKISENIDPQYIRTKLKNLKGTIKAFQPRYMSWTKNPSNILKREHHGEDFDQAESNCTQEV